MIVVRNTFRLKFGAAREAIAIMKEGLAIQKRAGVDVSQRLLTDLSGQFYTIVLELTLPNLAAIETTMSKVMGDKDWQANYQKFTPLVESGHREIFNVVDLWRAWLIVAVYFVKNGRRRRSARLSAVSRSGCRRTSQLCSHAGHR